VSSTVSGNRENSGLAESSSTTAAAAAAAASADRTQFIHSLQRKRITVEFFYHVEF
jgi:hypothetical protein